MPLDDASNELFMDRLEHSAPLFEGPPPQRKEISARHHHHRRRPWVVRHKAATVLLVLLALIAGTGIGLVLFIRSLLGGIEHLGDPFAGLGTRPPYATGAAGQPVTFLVLGSDSRIDSKDPSQWEVGAQRTDTIMVMQISGDRKRVNVMSIPRDSWVTIPANDVVDHDSRAKINAAYSWGGPTLLIRTVENVTGIHIDHFAIANFESFKTLTDELGGVDITLTQPLDLTGRQDAANSDNVLAPGAHRLTGEQALVYARERYTLPDGDFGRIKRQQNWMRSILKAAVDGGTLTDPVKLAGLIETVTKTVAVDDALTTSAMIDLASSMTGIRSSNVNFFQAPVQGTSTSADGQSIVLLDAVTLAEVSRAFQTDSISQYVAEHPDKLNVLGGVVN